MKLQTIFKQHLFYHYPVMGFALDVGFLCDKATVIVEDMTNVRYYVSAAMRDLS
jgi:hypothetical protein